MIGMTLTREWRGGLMAAATINGERIHFIDPPSDNEDEPAFIARAQAAFEKIAARSTGEERSNG